MAKLDKDLSTISSNKSNENTQDERNIVLSQNNSQNNSSIKSTKNINARLKEAEENIKRDVNLFIKDNKTKKNIQKTCLSLYIEDEDLKLLKAIAYTHKTSVNKYVLEALIKEPLDSTREAIKDYDDINIDTLAKKYDNTYGKKKRNKQE